MRSRYVSYYSFIMILLNYSRNKMLNKNEKNKIHYFLNKINGHDGFYQG